MQAETALRPALVISGRYLGAKVAEIPYPDRGPVRPYRVLDGDLAGRWVWVLPHRVKVIKEQRK